MPKQLPKPYDTWHASKKPDKTRTFPLHQSKDDLVASLISITEFSPEDVAKQITLLDAEAFRQIPHSEFFDYGKRKKDCVWIKNCSHRFNQTMFWGRAEILASFDCRKRGCLLTYFIKIAKHLHAHNNFQGFAAIITALNSAPISRLKKSWEHVEKKDKVRFEKFVQCINPESNYSNLRNVLPPPPTTTVSPSFTHSSSQNTPAVVPFLGMFLLELEYLESADQLIQQCGSRLGQRRATGVTTASTKTTSTGAGAAPGLPPRSPVSMMTSQQIEKNNNNLQIVREKKGVAAELNSARRLSTPNESSLLLTANASTSSDTLSGISAREKDIKLHNVKLCNIVNLLITYHRYAYYDFEQNPHILNSIKSNSCIEELVKICEADQYKRSLELEPQTTSSPSGKSSLTVGGHTLLSASPRSGGHELLNGGASTTPSSNRQKKQDDKNGNSSVVSSASPSPQHNGGGGCFTIAMGGAGKHRKSKSVGGKLDSLRVLKFRSSRSSIYGLGSSTVGGHNPINNNNNHMNLLDMPWILSSKSQKSSLPTPMMDTNSGGTLSLLDVTTNTPSGGSRNLLQSTIMTPSNASSFSPLDGVGKSPLSVHSNKIRLATSGVSVDGALEINSVSTGGFLLGGGGRKSPSQSEDFILSSHLSEFKTHDFQPDSVDAERKPAFEEMSSSTSRGFSMTSPVPPKIPPKAGLAHGGHSNYTPAKNGKSKVNEDAKRPQLPAESSRSEVIIPYPTSYQLHHQKYPHVQLPVTPLPYYDDGMNCSPPATATLCTTRFPSRHSFDSALTHEEKPPIFSSAFSTSSNSQIKRPGPFSGMFSTSSSGAAATAGSPLNRRYTASGACEGLPMKPDDKLVGFLRKKLVLTNGKRTRMSYWRKCWVTLGKDGILSVFPHKMLHAPGGKRMNHYHKVPSERIDLSMNGWTVLRPSNKHNTFILKSDYLGKVYRFDTGGGNGDDSIMFSSGPWIEEWTSQIDACTDLIKFDSPPATAALDVGVEEDSIPIFLEGFSFSSSSPLRNGDVISLVETEDDDDELLCLDEVGAGPFGSFGFTTADTKPLTPIL